MCHIIIAANYSRHAVNEAHYSLKTIPHFPLLKNLAKRARAAMNTNPQGAATHTTALMAFCPALLDSATLAYVTTMISMAKTPVWNSRSPMCDIKSISRKVRLHGDFKLWRTYMTTTESVSPGRHQGLHTLEATVLPLRTVHGPGRAKWDLMLLPRGAPDCSNIST